MYGYKRKIIYTYGQIRSLDQSESTNFQGTGSDGLLTKLDETPCPGPVILGFRRVRPTSPIFCPAFAYQHPGFLAVQSRAWWNFRILAPIVGLTAWETT